ncbi:YkvA family protein [Bosea sp. (in: a-proteobacteria)]|uniref:YkvA family protein n=1 Tax=Bosea sp. (in: a-proteobacteria) TaxID=1871050 RepID=UPI0025BFF3D1|nr:YkvA family protein [Bosea sp. (in: a-proteobacteria)]
MPGIIDRLRQRAKDLKRDINAIYLASRDPRTPWPVRWLAIAIVAYALSPIDLIPDFIPVLGYLDDLVIVPGGIFLLVQLIPPEVMREHRLAASNREHAAGGRAAAAVIVGIWLLCSGFAVWAAYRYFRH